MTAAISTASPAPSGAGRCSPDTGRRFTDAELNIARETDLPDLLSSLGYHVKRVGSYHTTKEMDSLRIKDRRVWFRYSKDVGGDAIAFLQHFQNKSFVDAVDFLLAYHGHARDFPSMPPPALKKEKTPFVLPPENADHRRVFAYLQKRGVAPQVIFSGRRFAPLSQFMSDEIVRLSQKARRSGGVVEAGGPIRYCL